MMPVQVSAKRKLVGVPFTPEVKNLFQDIATEVDLAAGKVLLIPHLPAQTFMLRRLGYDVPAPILSQYNWPHPANEPPFEAQRNTAALLCMSPRAFVLNGMGTGKTRAALWAWDYLRSIGIAGRLLVVAPLSTLKFTWGREIFNALPHRTYAVLHGSRKKRQALLELNENEIFVVNHDGFRIIRDHLPSDVDTIVLDELAVYRNGGTQRTKDMRKFVAQPHIKWVWGMTGSPIPNSPTDAWAQASIINPILVPKYFKRFQADLMIKVSEFKWIPKDDAVERAYKVLQPAVRYTLDDVYELPETIERSIDIELGPKQKKAYDDLSKFCYHAVQNGEITAANAGAVMSKLLQVSCGWVYTREGNTIPLDNDKRVEALIDAVLSTDRKCLVFVPYKHALQGISDALTKEGIGHAVVSGDTSANERAEIFSLFQNTRKYHAIAAHPSCMSHGLTLTAADTIIWFSPTTSLETYEQVNARISRVGQKHKQLILHFQATPVERRLYKLLQEKQKVQEQLLEMFAMATTQGDLNA